MDYEPVSAGSHETYDLTFTAPDECVGTESTLLVDGTPAIKTVTGSVTAVKKITPADYMGPLVAAGVLGLAFLTISAWRLRKKLDDRTAGGKSWSFSDSWLTSISAVSTGLAGVLAASGFVAEVLPGVPLGHFLGLSVTFGLMVVAAPMVFSIFQVTELEPGTPTEDDPTPDAVLVVNGRLIGVLVAGALTCAAVGGQLAMLAVLTSMSQASDGSKNAVLILLGLAVLLLAAYVINSTNQAQKMSESRSDRQSDANTVKSGAALSARYAAFSGTF